MFLEGETADQWEKRDRGLMGTGSHVVWNGKPLTSLKNRSWARGGENAGSKSKVQFLEEGWSLKTTQNEINHVLLICFTITVVSFEFLFDKCSFYDECSVTGIHRGRS